MKIRIYFKNGHVVKLSDVFDISYDDNFIHIRRAALYSSYRYDEIKQITIKGGVIDDN